MGDAAKRVPEHGITLRGTEPVVGPRTGGQQGSVGTHGIVAMFLSGQSMADIARIVSLTPEQVEKAIRFECCATCKCDACGWARELADKP